MGQIWVGFIMYRDLNPKVLDLYVSYIFYLGIKSESKSNPVIC